MSVLSSFYAKLKVEKDTSDYFYTVGNIVMLCFTSLEFSFLPIIEFTIFLYPVLVFLFLFNITSEK